MEGVTQTKLKKGKDMDAHTPHAQSSPLMKQFFALKEEVPDALLLFRMGDFYEFFGEDAVHAAKALDVTLTSRDKNKEQPLPMCGVPHHSLDQTLQKLLAKGFKAAVAEQMEDAKKLKAGTLVKRSIVRILSPGVHFESEGQSEERFLVSITSLRASEWVAAGMDASTGFSFVTQAGSWEEVLHHLRPLPVAQILETNPFPIKKSQLKEVWQGKVLIESLPPHYVSTERAQEVLARHFGSHAQDGVLPEPQALLAFGVVLTYVLRSQHLDFLDHGRPPVLIGTQGLRLGPRVEDHLDLRVLQRVMLDRSQLCGLNAPSGMGCRALASRLRSPLTARGRIEWYQERQRAWLTLSSAQLAAVAQAFEGLPDLERIWSRIHITRAQGRPVRPRDVGALLRSLVHLEAWLKKDTFPPPLESMRAELRRALTESGLGACATYWMQGFVDTLPSSSQEGGLFRLGFDATLDVSLRLATSSSEEIKAFEEGERQRTGISTLRVRDVRLFGLLMEVTASQAAKVPTEYIRRQTLKGAERYVTQALVEFEKKLRSAAQSQLQREQELFQACLDALTPFSQALRTFLTELQAFEADWIISHMARSKLQPTQLRQDWCLPSLDESLDFEVKKGAHAILMERMEARLIRNDLSLSAPQHHCLTLTGPNMGGKSTLLRQTGLQVLLGQSGCWIPAASARWGIFSSIFTRIGAQDHLLEGKSTFLVEMSELAMLFHQSDTRSLLILDEIGRGTSTYDGLSLAWASCEWLCQTRKARALFATHYHELTQLEGKLPGFKNAHLSVSKESGLHFEYQLRKGPIHDSFGIDVARMAGVPPSILARASEVLKDLEATSRQAKAPKVDPPVQLDWLESSTYSMPVELRAWLTDILQLDLNEKSPMEVFRFLAQWMDQQPKTLQGLTRKTDHPTSWLGKKKGRLKA
jgi:DNA mismatch repair protein MutS